MLSTHTHTCIHTHKYTPTCTLHTHKQQASPQRGSVKRYNRGTMGQEDCESCGNRVFLMERLGVENHVFHRSCFRCSTCYIQLKVGSYEFDAKSDKFYCKTHYREVLRQQTIKRTMDQRGITSFEEKDKDINPRKPKRKKKFSSPEPEQNGTGDVLTITKTNVAPTAGQQASSGSDLSREQSQKVKAGLPSLLKTLAVSKQQEEEKTLGVSASAGNTPTSSPVLGTKSRLPPQSSLKTTAVRAPEENHKPAPETKPPQEVASATKEPQPASKGPEIPRSTVSWLTKGKTVVSTSEEPVFKVTTETQRSEITRRSYTTTAADNKSNGVPPRPKPPVLKTGSNLLTKSDSKTASKVAKEVEQKQELHTVVEQPEKFPPPSTNDDSSPPIKPPRRNKQDHPEQKHAKPAEPPPPPPAAVSVLLEPPSTPATKKEESLEKSSEGTIPQRPSIRPKRPAPPRPSHPPSFRAKGSPKRAPTTKSKS